jgi:hypothetical protein
LPTSIVTQDRLSTGDGEPRAVFTGMDQLASPAARTYQLSIGRLE